VPSLALYRRHTARRTQAIADTIVKAMDAKAGRIQTTQQITSQVHRRHRHVQMALNQLVAEHKLKVTWRSGATGQPDPNAAEYRITATGRAAATRMRTVSPSWADAHSQLPARA
jgi:hypothetical protein